MSPARRRILLVAYAAVTTGCAADAGPELKTDEDGAVLPDTSSTIDGRDGSATLDSSPGFDNGTPPDTLSPIDSTATDTTGVVDGGADSPIDVGTDSGIDSATDAAVTDATCPTCPLTLQYMTPTTAATSTEMKPHIDLKNGGTTDQPLTEITVRYWFTINGDHALINFCDYAKLGCANVTGSYTKLATPKATADYYFELQFTPGAGNVAPGGSTGEIQLRLSKSDFSTWTQTDDWSFDATKTAYAPWDHITIYRKGVLVYGVEPP